MLNRESSKIDFVLEDVLTELEENKISRKMKENAKLAQPIRNNNIGNNTISSVNFGGNNLDFLFQKEASNSKNNSNLLSPVYSPEPSKNLKKFFK